MAIFSKCLSKTDVEKRLSVPSKSLKYFPLSGEHHAVDFKAKDENGRVWTFRCSIRNKKHPKPVLTKGWREFVSTKKLEIGDKVEFCKEDELGTGGAGYCVKVKKVVRVFGTAFGHVPIGLPDEENTSILTAEENESDDSSANRSGALNGARLSPNTSAVDTEAQTESARNGSGQNYRKVALWEWIFVVSNLTVELPSAVFDQLSSPHKPLYALMAMALSLLALVLCVIELLYEGMREGITFKCPRGKMPWFYYPSRSQNHKRFGTFADLIGLLSAISQCIVTALNYDFARRAANSPIKFSLLPIIFALCLLCSRILKTLEKNASERQDR